MTGVLFFDLWPLIRRCSSCACHYLRVATELAELDVDHLRTGHVMSWARWWYFVVIATYLRRLDELVLALLSLKEKLRRINSQRIYWCVWVCNFGLVSKFEGILEWTTTPNWSVIFERFNDPSRKVFILIPILVLWRDLLGNCLILVLSVWSILLVSCSWRCWRLLLPKIAPSPLRLSLAVFLDSKHVCQAQGVWVLVRHEQV